MTDAFRVQTPVQFLEQTQAQRDAYAVDWVVLAPHARTGRLPDVACSPWRRLKSVRPGRTLGIEWLWVWQRRIQFEMIVRLGVIVSPGMVRLPPAGAVCAGLWSIAVLSSEALC